MKVVCARLRTNASGNLVVELEIDTPEQPKQGDEINVTLVSHGEISSDFFASLWCKYDEGVWTGSVQLESSDPYRILEIVTVKSADTSIPIDCPGLFMKPSTPGDWVTGDGANGELHAIQERRRRIFEVPITANGALASGPSFRIAMLVDNLHLTRPQLVPGLQAMPISGPLVSASVIAALNSIIGSFGFDASWDPNQLPPHIAQQRPTAVLYAPQVLAADAAEAQQESSNLARRLLDLFALRRGDAPRLLVGVVGRNDSNGNVSFEGLWLEGAGYRGNLLGGFISGEDQEGLLAQWKRLDATPRITLWISLYADALADPRWDYRAFRCFNLLEGIATEVLPRAAPIVDPTGSPILKVDGKPYTTADARGKIYELLRKVATAMEEAEGNHVPNPHTPRAPSLWDWLGTWVSIRNEVAHTGSWDLPAGRTPSAKHAAITKRIESFGHDGSFTTGIGSILRAMQLSVDSTLYAFLRGRL